MDLEDADRLMHEIVATIPARARTRTRTYLLEVLITDEGARALEIGHLYQLQVAPSTVELLIDAEADPVRGRCWSGCCGKAESQSESSQVDGTAVWRAWSSWR